MPSRKFLIRVAVILLIPVVWYGWRFYEKQRQESAVRAIRAAGGDVAIRSEMRWPMLLIFINADIPRHVDLSETEASDADIRHVNKLRFFDWLSLSHTNITDEGLKDLRRLGTFFNLNLEGTDISDEGLRHLRAAWRLTWLDLSGTDITSDGLRHQVDLEYLRYLDLDDT